MEATHEVLLLDEAAELEDVRRMLDDLGVRYAQVSAARLQEGVIQLPSRLLIATARHALDLEVDRGRAASTAARDGSQRIVRIAVLEQGTKTLQGRLRERGFDYLVRRPVHPVALRLLLLRALYRGDERRVAERLPIGTFVGYRTGLRRRPGLLADLSIRGCRLLVPRDAEPDTPITVYLPKELTGGPSLSLSGWVLRCDSDEREVPDRRFCLAVVFEELGSQTGQLLSAFLRSRTTGPETIPVDGSPPNPPPIRERERVALRQRPTAHFRSAPRRRFRGQIAAMKSRGEAMRTLVGCNLSTGGVLVEPTPNLACGDRLCLAIFGAPGERIVVRAHVVRDDGEAGLALRFDPLSTEVRQQLEVMLQRLPSVERLVDGEQRNPGLVVAEIESRPGRS